MKKIIMVLAAAVIAVGFVFGLQWYEQYKIATFIEQQGPAAARQTMDRFGPLLGSDARLELGKVSAGLDSVTIENPVLVCDAGLVQRVAAAKAVLTAVEMQGDYSAIARMDLTLYGVNVQYRNDAMVVQAAEFSLANLRLENGDPYPTLAADRQQFKDASAKFDSSVMPTIKSNPSVSGHWHIENGTYEQVKLNSANTLFNGSGILNEMTYTFTFGENEIAISAAKARFTNALYTAPGLSNSPVNGVSVRLLMEQNLVDDMTIDDMHIKLSASKEVIGIDIDQTSYSANLESGAPHYTIEALGILPILQAGEAADQYKQFWADLGYSPDLKFSCAMDFALSFTDKTYDLRDFSLWSAKLGKLSLSFAWNGIDYEKLFDNPKDKETMAGVSLSDLALTYQDDSLANSLKRYFAKRSGTSVLAINAQLLATSMAGGAIFEDPDERKAAMAGIRFLLNPGTISIRFKPQKPMCMATLSKKESPGQDFNERLKRGEITVTYTPPPGAEKEKL